MGDMSREPSMEEILSSIRRVIARDEAQRVPVAGSSAPVANPAAVPSSAAAAPSSAATPAFAPLAHEPAAAVSESAFADAGFGVGSDADDILELTELTDEAEAPLAHDVPLANDAPLGHDLPLANTRPAANTRPLPPSPQHASGLPSGEAVADLLSNDSLDASARALGTLAAAVNGDAPAAAPPLTGAATTVDALVEAALRPLLKNWLDANLSTVVERLVAREIAKITGARP